MGEYMTEHKPIRGKGRPRLSEADKQDSAVVKKRQGRPPKFRDEFADMLLDFFSQPPTKEITVRDKYGNKTVQILPNTFPTLARFATNIGVTRETLHDWATAKNPDGSHKHANFSYSYKKAKDLQEANLVEGTICGAYNSTFAIFTAKNVLGWRDKVDQEITGKDGAPLGPVSIAVQFINPDGSVASIDS